MIGSRTKQWNAVTLGEIIDIFDHVRIPLNSAQRSERKGPYPYYGASGIIDGVDDFLFDGEYILVAEDGENLNSRKLPVAFPARGRFWVNNHAHIIKGKKGVADDRFLMAWFANADIKGYITGAAQPKLSQGNLKRIALSVPPLATQRKIAGVLSAYDDLIENNTRRIAILEEMAQAIYREWFVHFRFPGHESAHFTDSPFGKIPEGWKASFSDYVEFLEGPGLRRWQYRDDGIPFLNIRTIGNNDIDLSKCQFIDPAEVSQKYSHFLLRPLDHIVSSSGTIGRIATVQNHHLPLMLNTSIIRMAPRTSAVGRWQLKHFLQSPYFQEQIVAHASGVAQMNFGPSHLKLMWIIAPDEKTGLAYEHFVGEMENLLCLLVKKNKILRATRDLLLPKLVSGQLDVEDLDIDAGELQTETLA